MVLYYFNSITFLFDLDLEFLVFGRISTMDWQCNTRDYYRVHRNWVALDNLGAISQGETSRDYGVNPTKKRGKTLQMQSLFIIL